MDKSLQLSFGPITKFISRYHFSMFILLIGVPIIAALIMLLSLLGVAQDVSTADGAPSTAKLSASFDETTVKRLDTLQDSQQQSKPLELPKNVRYNPFVE